MPLLHIQSGARQGENIGLTEEVITIGSAPGNKIELSAAEVAPFHATLVEDEGDYVLSDQQSSAGTFVNGVKIDEQRLHPGDQICLGNVLMRYESEIGLTVEPGAQESLPEECALAESKGTNPRWGLMLLALTVVAVAGVVFLQRTPRVADVAQSPTHTPQASPTPAEATSPTGEPAPNLEAEPRKPTDLPIGNSSPTMPGGSSPIDPAGSDGLVLSAGRTPRASAEAIVLPLLDFRNATVRESIDFLRVKSSELDRDRKGVTILLQPTAGTDAQITLNLRSVSVMDALKYVVELADLELRAEPFAMVVQSATSPRRSFQPLTAIATPGTPESEIINRANRIILPQIAFRDAGVDEGMEFLRVRSAHFDPDHRGVNIVVKHSAKSGAARLTISASNIPVTEALVRLAESAGLQLAVHAGAFYLHPSYDTALPTAPPQAAMPDPFAPVAPAPRPTSPSALPPRVAIATTPAVTLSWQRAVEANPDLGIDGSDLNQAFAAVVSQLKAVQSPLLQRDDWPQLVAAEALRSLPARRRR